MNVARRMWTDDEVEYLKQNYLDMTVDEIASELDRTSQSVKNKARLLKISKNKKWTEEEIEYLHNLDARDTLRKVAKKLGRTEQSVASKMQALDLWFNEFATGYNPSYIEKSMDMTPCTMLNYFKRRGGKWTKLVHGKKKRTYQVEGEAFWKIVKKYPHDFNLKAYERLSILPEPDWLDEAIDICQYEPREQKEWTIKEEMRLKEMKKKGMTYKEISTTMNRSLYSVKNKHLKLERLKHEHHPNSKHPI